MTDKFEIGEVAIYVREGSPNYGKEVVIKGPLKTVVARQDWSDLINVIDGHEVVLPSDWEDGPFTTIVDVEYVAIEHLRKKPRPPVRESLGEWELCPWRPSETVAGGT